MICSSVKCLLRMRRPPGGHRSRADPHPEWPGFRGAGHSGAGPRRVRHQRAEPARLFPPAGRRLSVPPRVAAAPPYGVNIPGGLWLTRQSVERALQSLPSLAFAGIVGRPDSFLVWGDASGTEDWLRRGVTEALDCPCVVIGIAGLQHVLGAALGALEVSGASPLPPYRLTFDGVEWEWCLVLCSEPLPPTAAEPGWLFPPTRNAVARAVLGRRALLARKRRRTTRGARIMLGATLIDPWTRVLEGQGTSVACLTSRTLNRVAQVVTAAGLRCD